MGPLSHSASSISHGSSLCIWGTQESQAFKSHFNSEVDRCHPGVWQPGDLPIPTCRCIRNCFPCSPCCSPLFTPHSLQAQVKFLLNPIESLPEQEIYGMINSMLIAVEGTGVTDNYRQVGWRLHFSLLFHSFVRQLRCPKCQPSLQQCDLWDPFVV